MTAQPWHMKPHPVCSSKYTLSMWYHSQYSVSSHPLYWKHHTHSLYDITLSNGTASLHYRRHYILIFWNQTTIFMTSHSLYLTLYQCYFCHHIHSIDDITPTLFMRSHSLYMSTSYKLYTTTYSLYLYHESHCTCVWHTLFRWYHTLCIYDIALTICLTSDTIYKVSHPQFMTSRHIIYDITCTVFMTSLPRYLPLHPQYLCPHNPSKYDLGTTVCITSQPLYIWYLMQQT